MTTPLLTDAEHELVAALGEVWNSFCRVVGNGPTRDHDLAEIVAHVHALQHKVMGQAAARAYPGRYRVLGGVVGGDPQPPGDGPAEPAAG